MRIVCVYSFVFASRGLKFSPRLSDGLCLFVSARGEGRQGALSRLQSHTSQLNATVVYCCSLQTARAVKGRPSSHWASRDYMYCMPLSEASRAQREILSSLSCPRHCSNFTRFFEADGNCDSRQWVSAVHRAGHRASPRQARFVPRCNEQDSQPVSLRTRLVSSSSARPER